MPKRTLSLCLFALVLAGLLASRLSLRAQPHESPLRPKLVVAIIIDQLRSDYLVRFRPYFVQGGFNLLLGGADFVNCRYDYAITATGPGHATLFTGAYPNVHGIVGNDWYDRSLHRTVNCVEDPEARRVDTQEGPSGVHGASPRHLIGSTVTDELRLASGFRSRVISIALKDRSAILPGGHTASAAYWYDGATGRFVSSTYYMSALPSWVAKFNDEPPSKAYCGKVWQALPETPRGEGQVFGELKLDASVPCPNEQFLQWIDNTPFMNEIELRFALEAVKNERLGQEEATDFLIVGLSVNDYIGHRYGPYSPQVADLTLRTDRRLAEFFHELDRLVGLDNVWIVLSADHGVAPTPRFIAQHRLGIANFQGQSIGQAIDDALVQAYGRREWVLATASNNIYLNEPLITKRGLDLSRVESTVAEAAMSVRGVKAAFSRGQILTGNLPDDPVARKVAAAFEAHRSGNVVIVLEPYAFPGLPETQATHGGVWNYDAQVPMILWGSAFRSGLHPIPCETIDLAPTLAVALGLMQPSGAQGQPLTPALRLPQD